MKNNFFLLSLLLYSLYSSNHAHTPPYPGPPLGIQQLPTGTTRNMSFLQTLRRDAQANVLQTRHDLITQTATEIANILHLLRTVPYPAKDALQHIKHAVREEARLLKHHKQPKQAHATLQLLEKNSHFNQAMDQATTRAAQEQSFAWYHYIYPQNLSISAHLIFDILNAWLTPNPNISIADKTDQKLLKQSHDEKGFEKLGLTQKDEAKLTAMIKNL